MAKTKDHHLVKASVLFNKLEDLSSERKNFEETDLARTNLRLYQLLAEIYETYQKAKEDPKVFKATVKAMKDALTNERSRVLTNTTTLSLFVRFVFRCDRQTVHSYARAIEAAITFDIPPDKLCEFIQDQGGVQECNRKVTVNSKVNETKEKIKAGLPIVDEQLEKAKSRPLAEIKADKDLLDAIKNSQLVFLLGSKATNGKVSVLSVVPSFRQSVLTWAKNELALWSANKEQVSVQRELEKAKNDSIEVAAASVKAKATGKVNQSKRSATVAQPTVGEVINS